MYQIKNNNEIYLYDDIMEGITARKVIEAVKEMAGDITLRINSGGGDVFEAIALYNVLKPLNVTVYVDGICASAASVIAMCGRVIMPKSAMMMIHNPAGMVYGDADDMRDMSGLLDKIRDNIVGIYASKTGLGHDEIVDMMDRETWFNGEEAMRMKFADEVSGEIVNKSGKTYADGVRDERERLKALDGVMSPGRESVIMRAKYETYESAQDVALELLRIESRRKDGENAGSEVIELSQSGQGRGMAEIINKARGYKHA